MYARPNWSIESLLIYTLHTHTHMHTHEKTVYCTCTCTCVHAHGRITTTYHEELCTVPFQPLQSRGSGVKGLTLVGLAYIGRDVQFHDDITLLYDIHMYYICTWKHERIDQTQVCGGTQPELSGRL